MRKVGGVGLLALVIVVLVVMLLAAGSWKSVAPTAIEVTNPGASAPDDGNDDLPDLRETREETSQHAEELRKALEETNR